MNCNTLTPDEIASIKARIVKLEASYDALMSGGAIKRFVDQNGEQVEYTAASASGLLAYINSLKAQIDACFARGYKPRPIGFVFPRQ
jgi:uncharacterized protein (DUF885 family)